MDRIEMIVHFAGAIRMTSGPNGRPWTPKEIAQQAIRMADALQAELGVITQKADEAEMNREVAKYEVEKARKANNSTDRPLMFTHAPKGTDDHRPAKYRRLTTADLKNDLIVWVRDKDFNDLLVPWMITKLQPWATVEMLAFDAFVDAGTTAGNGPPCDS